MPEGRELPRFATWLLLEGEFAGRVHPAASTFVKTSALTMVSFFPLISGSSVSKLTDLCDSLYGTWAAPTAGNGWLGPRRATAGQEGGQLPPHQQLRVSGRHSPP